MTKIHTKIPRLTYTVTKEYFSYIFFYKNVISYIGLLS